MKWLSVRVSAERYILGVPGELGYPMILTPLKGLG